MLPMLQVTEYIKGGWIQTLKPSAYKFPNSEKALDDAIEAAGETLGPALLSMSEFLMSSFNESYQSRCVESNSKSFSLFTNSIYSSGLGCLIKMKVDMRALLN